MSANEVQEPTSADEVRQRYREMVEARALFQRHQGGSFEGPHHENFHDAVFNLYAEMRGRLKHRDVAQDLWEDVELWPIQPVFEEFLVCQECLLYAPREEVEEEPGDTCPNCADGSLTRETRQKTDEDGEVVREWETGLKNLNRYRNRMRERTKEYSDALGTHQEVVRERQLLEPWQLEDVADLLAEAMEVLGLYPDAEASSGIQTDEIR